MRAITVLVIVIVIGAAGCNQLLGGRELTRSDSDGPGSDGPASDGPASDAPSINFAQATTPVGEQTSPAMVTVELSGPSSKDVTFSIVAVAGSALAGTDFTLPSQPVTIAAGGTSAVVPIAITDDFLDEDDESATLSLTGLGNASPGTTPARAHSDDPRQRPAAAGALRSQPG